MIAGDLNADGREDLVAAHGGWDQVGVFLSRPAALSNEAVFDTEFENDPDQKGTVIGDVTGDGRADIVLASTYAGVVVMPQLASGSTPDRDDDNVSDYNDVCVALDDTTQTLIATASAIDVRTTTTMTDVSTTWILVRATPGRGPTAARRSRPRSRSVDPRSTLSGTVGPAACRSDRTLALWRASKGKLRGAGALQSRVPTGPFPRRQS